MDLQLYIRVLWRFRLLVAAGVLLAVGLAFASLVRVESGQFSYRESEKWASTSRLFVTQPGFPEGRVFLADEIDAEEQARQLGIRFADPNRFTSLAVLYAQLATSDRVRRIMLSDGPIRGKIIADPVLVQQNVALPLIDVTAISTDPAGAVALGNRATDAMTTYLSQQQAANDVPISDRVVLELVERPRDAQLFQGRSKTFPIVTFFTVLIATVGLAFVLENLRPRVRPVLDRVEAKVPSSARRSA